MTTEVTNKVKDIKRTLTRRRKENKREAAGICTVICD